MDSLSSFPTDRRIFSLTNGECRSLVFAVYVHFSVQICCFRRFSILLKDLP